MTSSATVSIEYGIDLDTDCGGTLFEIPITQVVGGDIIEMRIWSRSHDILKPYTIFKGTEPMGEGQEITTTSDEITAIVDFAETYKYQAEYPIDTIVSIEAITEIVIIDETTGDVITWATKGETVTDKFSKFGYSCVQELLKTPLYGSVRVIYERPPYYKLWEWTVPVGAEGLYWFFIYKDNIIKNKFSIELPDLTDGPVDYRNITIYVTARDGGGAITNAAVTIDDIYRGLTDSNGAITIDSIQVGSHSIKVIADGFLDTDLDNLYNDTLTVY